MGGAPEQALEALAFKEADRRPRHAAAWALAAASAAARAAARSPLPASAAADGSSSSATNGSSGPGSLRAASMRVLWALPEEGAMRALCEHVIAFADQPGTSLSHIL